MGQSQDAISAKFDQLRIARRFGVAAQGGTAAAESRTEDDF